MRNSLFLLLLSGLLFTSNFAKSLPIDATDQVKMTLAKQKFYAGDVVGALNLYKEVLVKNPKDASVLHFVGLCHFTLKDYEKAAEHFNKAKETNKDIKYETYLYTGKLFIKNKLRRKKLWKKMLKFGSISAIQQKQC